MANIVNMEKEILIIGAALTVAYLFYRQKRGNAIIIFPPAPGGTTNPPAPIPQPEVTPPIAPPPPPPATTAPITGKWKDYPGLTYPNFSKAEFDSPDAPGSGGNMQVSFMNMLQLARTIAGVSFHINSGFRTQAHNAEVGGVANSAHTRGYAADIAVTASTKQTILLALQQAGFKRIGIGNTFIHADNDPTLPSPATWYY